jgi:hypothetical protein
MIGTFDTLCCVAGGWPTAIGERTPDLVHTHTYLLEREREKQFLCACGERGFRHTRGKEQSERGREKKWISILTTNNY